MTESEIAHAKARANDCINGFMQVRMQQARDVVRLAEQLQEADRRINELEARRYQAKQDQAGFSGAFDSIFSDLMRGKK